MEVKTQLSKIGQELEIMMNKVRFGLLKLSNVWTAANHLCTYSYKNISHLLVDNLDPGHNWRRRAVPWAAQQAAPPEPLPHDHLQAQPHAGQSSSLKSPQSLMCFACRCTAGQRVTWSRTWTRSSLPGRRSCAWSTWRCWGWSTRIWSDSTSTLHPPTLSFTFPFCRWSEEITTLSQNSYSYVLDNRLSSGGHGLLNPYPSHIQCPKCLKTSYNIQILRQLPRWQSEPGKQARWRRRSSGRLWRSRISTCSRQNAFSRMKPTRIFLKASWGPRFEQKLSIIKYEHWTISVCLLSKEWWCSKWSVESQVRETSTQLEGFMKTVGCQL